MLLMISEQGPVVTVMGHEITERHPFWMQYATPVLPSRRQEELPSI